MNGQDLKNSILQLAIQGKLVEQRQEESTAKELLEQIRAEKERLVKEGKVKKQKALPEITEDEIPFDIPENWGWVRLGNICEKIGSGSTPTGGKAVYKESGIKFLRSQNVYNDRLRLADVAFISEEQNKQGSIVKPMDILLNITGGSIGRCALVPDDFDTANINQHVMIIRNIVPENRFFLHNVLISPYVQSMIMSVQVGVSREGLSAEKLKDFLIPLPPLEEQKRIVAKIEELLPYVDLYDDAHAKVEELNKIFPQEMQKSILQYAIQGKLVEQRQDEGTAEELYKQIQVEKAKLVKEGMIKREKPLPVIMDDEIPFDIPDTWKWVRLGDITHNWGQKKPDKPFDYIDVSSIDNIRGVLGKDENLIVANDAPSRARKIVKEGTVLYSTVRPYLLNICIIDKQFKYEPIASTAFAVLHPLKGLFEKYLYFVLRSPMCISYVSSVMVGVAYPAINDANLLSGLIPLPPLAEQKRIVAKIEELMPFTKQLVK